MEPALLRIRNRLALMSLGAALFLSSKLPVALPPTGMPLAAKVMVAMPMGSIPPLLLKAGCTRMMVSLPSMVPRTPRSVNMSQPVAQPRAPTAGLHVGVAASGLLLGHKVTGVERLRASDRASLNDDMKADALASMAREPMNCEYCGAAIAARMAVIATTTINSIRVTPRMTALLSDAAMRLNRWWVTWLMVKVW